MINELDAVVLLQDLPEQGLQRGDVGAVVHRYREGEAFEVEFVTGEGRTVGVLTLPAAAVRRMRHGRWAGAHPTPYGRRIARE